MVQLLAEGWWLAWASQYIRLLLFERAYTQHNNLEFAAQIYSQAEYAHNEFWLNQRDLCRTMDSLVEDYMDEYEDLEGEYDSEDMLFS